jgi:MFS family permease
MYSNSRWNFIVLVLDASFYFAAIAVMDTVAVLPVFLRTLTQSTLIIGLLLALYRAGLLLPQLPVASYLAHRPRKKPLFITAAVLGRLPIALLALFIYLFAASQAGLLLWLLIACYTVFFFSSGFTNVPWQDIIAKAIPPTMRGKLLGAIQVCGGLFALGAGEIVRRVLGNEAIPYPQNYAWLFLLFFVGLVISIGFIASIKEPIRPVQEEPQGVRALLSQIPRALREIPAYRRMIIVQLLLGIGFMAQPFYIGHAQITLHVPAWFSGVFVWAATIGAIVGSLAWGLLSDHYGSARVIRGVSWVVFLAPVTAIIVPYLALPTPACYYAYALVFALDKAAVNGIWLGFINYVLELVPEKERPCFIGMTAVLTIPMIIMPFLGGVLLNFVPYAVVFALTASGGLLGWFWARHLPEPRCQEKPAHQA